jgi:hypothetical protein
MRGFIIIAFLVPAPALSFFDFIADQAREIATIAAYSSAVSDLIDEVDPHSPSADFAKSVRRQADDIQQQQSDVGHMSREVEYLLKGEEFSGKRMDQSIRATTNYLRRLKSLLAKAALLGSAGVTAINTAETNKTLNDIQKNQEIQILQISQRNLIDAEKEARTKKEWQVFADEQKAIRQGKVQNKTFLGKR